MLPRLVAAPCCLVLSLTLACSESEPSLGPSSDPCSTVAVAVTPGTQPTFTWTAACNMEALTVTLPGSGAIVWLAVSHNQTNSIAPSVNYGDTPAGAAFTANVLLPLASGTIYQVTLFRADGGQGSPVRAVGQARFLP